MPSRISPAPLFQRGILIPPFAKGRIGGIKGQERQFLKKVSGNVEGVVNGKNIRAKYEEYVMTYSISNNNILLSMNGKITTSCISSALTVSTSEQVEMGEGSRCATKGEMKVTDGINEVKMAFSNGAMTVYLNNQNLYTYTSCTEAEGRCR